MIYIYIPSAFKIIECESPEKAIEELRDYGWEVMESDLLTAVKDKTVSAPFMADTSFDRLLTKMYVFCLNVLDFTKNVAETNNKQETTNYKHFIECLKD